MNSTIDNEKLERPDTPTRLQRLTALLRRWGIETNGIAPIPKHERTDRRDYQHLLLWFAVNVNLPTMVIGAGGPIAFGLSFRDTAINVLISDFLACLIPAYFAIFGPKLGTRAMVQARYSFGVYGVVLPSFLNVLSMLGYLILNLIIGGQMLATVSPHLTANTGIVVIAIVSLVVSFCGYKTIHWFESLSFLPTILGIMIMLALGGPNLHAAVTTVPQSGPAIAPTLSFAAAVIASDFAWCTMTADYGVYHNPDASSVFIFTAVFTGMFLSALIMHLVGAVFAAASISMPLWAAAYDHGNNLGGLVSVVLAPTGAFGKLLMVLMSLTLSAPTAITMYSFGISLMNVSTWFAKVPRYVFAVVATAICIPFSIAGQTRFYDVLVAIIDIIGYYSASFAGIIFIEHILFRRGAFFESESELESTQPTSGSSSTTFISPFPGPSPYTTRGYATTAWNTAALLPPGIAAVLAFLCSTALVVPCMAQSFFVGPIGRAVGDVGLLVGFFSSCMFYAAFRAVEKRVWPGR
ncbi:hypothetical protein MKEN_00577500 [Mycena kentingensis (nom. inval.)]|nr:hypothetical protein MKEN_00577500 [Mycena kentingensis (nom. inval.)]